MTNNINLKDDSYLPVRIQGMDYDKNEKSKLEKYSNQDMSKGQNYDPVASKHEPYFVTLKDEPIKLTTVKSKAVNKQNINTEFSLIKENKNQQLETNQTTVEKEPGDEDKKVEKDGKTRKNGFLRFLRTVADFVCGKDPAAREQAERIKDLELGEFIDQKKYGPTFCNVYFKSTNNIKIDVENFHIEEHLFNLRRFVQWHNANNFLVELSNKPDPKSFVTSFDNLLYALKYLEKVHPRSSENGFISEMALQNIKMIYSLKKECNNKNIQQKKDILRWRDYITEIKKTINEKNAIASNTVYQNAEMMERAVNILLDENEILGGMVKAAVGGVKLWADGNPKELLIGLKDLSLGIGDKIKSNTLAQVFIFS